MNDNEKYQKDAMRKYIQKLENQETKIVSTPQTELDKELKKPSKFFGFEKKKPHWTCSQCGMNPAWLDYSVCYQCYVKNGRLY